jgi:hypothetical protein
MGVYSWNAFHLGLACNIHSLRSANRRYPSPKLVGNIVQISRSRLNYRQIRPRKFQAVFGSLPLIFVRSYIWQLRSFALFYRKSNRRNPSSVALRGGRVSAQCDIEGTVSSSPDTTHTCHTNSTTGKKSLSYNSACSSCLQYRCHALDLFFHRQAASSFLRLA